MGGLESRFNALLVEGKAEEAMEMWVTNLELQVRLQPNAQIKSSPYRDTPLHCAVRWEMKKLMMEFLTRGGDPFTTNGIGETPLHIVCRAGDSKISSRRCRRRADYLELMLDRIPNEENFEVIRTSNSLDRSSPSKMRRFQDKGGGAHSLLNGGADSLKMMAERDAHHLGVQDKSRNTPLHLAAASGLLECVELLVAHNAPLFIHNIAGQTPCDVAWNAKQIIIAKQLESKMVLDSEQLPGLSEEDCLKNPSAKRTKNKAFHNTETLKALKNDIVAKIAGKLQVSQHAAQALLVSYGWSEELVMEAWSSDREAARKKAGLDSKKARPDAATRAEQNGGEAVCGICDEEITVDGAEMPCQHRFCEECMKRFVEIQIDEGGGKEIRCPDTDCNVIIPDEEIAKLISKGQMEKYEDLSIRNFAASSSDIRWCPLPDCNYAVVIQKGSLKSAFRAGNGAAGEAKLTCGENMECGQGHGFCWNCMQDPHEPCSCEMWERWKELVIRNMTEEDKGRVAQEAQANAKWVMRNTKPCPNCQSPIQKNEGCNHMTCKKCNHDFCWVCLDPWNVHSHRTGGYFTCNRYNAQAKADRTVKQAQNAMEEQYVKKAFKDLEEHQEKFEHYHERYNNHLQSLDFEMKQLQHSKAKLQEMERLGQALDKKVAQVRAKVLMDTVQFADEACRSFPNLKGKNFLDDVFRALLHARRVLAASYCIGYFLPEEKEEAREKHDKAQDELEEVVETLSEMVRKEYLSSSQHQLRVAAKEVDSVCEEYLSSMQEVANIAGRAVMGIEDEEQRLAREQRERERQEREQPPTLEELLFFEHLIRLMDGGNGRLHVLLPPTTNGQ